ncbi:MAG: hypothetical protein ACJAVK_002796 [Akkermansiaceae bacterium]
MNQFRTGSSSGLHGFDIEVKESRGQALLAIPGDQGEGDFGLGDPAFAFLSENDTCRFGRGIESFF